MPEIPELVSLRFHSFQNWQQFWFGVHYLSGIVAVISGCLATAAGASSVPKFIQSKAWLWGLLAALFSATVTFLGPLQKAESYKHAYYHLSTAIAQFETGVIDVNLLLDKYEEAQNIVLLGDPTIAKKAADQKSRATGD